jgi:hypothetical protein
VGHHGGAHGGAQDGGQGVTGGYILFHSSASFFWLFVICSSLLVALKAASMPTFYSFLKRY